MSPETAPKGVGSEDQTLAIVYRGMNFYVIGVTREAEGVYDGAYRKHSCDLSLPAGKGRVKARRRLSRR
jgi:hypothetical protein